MLKLLLSFGFLVHLSFFLNSYHYAIYISLYQLKYANPLGCTRNDIKGTFSGEVVFTLAGCPIICTPCTHVQMYPSF